MKKLMLLCGLLALLLISGIVKGASTVVEIPTKDTYVNSYCHDGYPWNLCNQNYGGSTEISAGQWDDAPPGILIPFSNYVYTQYSLSSVPSNKIIKKAYLYLPLWTTQSYPAGASGLITLSFFEVYQDWNEMGITFMTQPTRNSTAFLTVDATTYKSSPYWNPFINQVSSSPQPEDTCWNVSAYGQWGWTCKFKQASAGGQYNKTMYYDITELIKEHYESDKLVNLMINFSGKISSAGGGNLGFPTKECSSWGKQWWGQPTPLVYNCWNYTPKIYIEYEAMNITEIKANTSLDYPQIFYLGEKNKVKYKFNSSFPTNATVKYRNALATVEWADNYANSGTFNDTNDWSYIDKDLIEIEMNITPYVDFVGFNITTDFWNGATNETQEFNKSSSNDPSSPDYVEVKYRYIPPTYPIDGKQLSLFFRRYTGEREDFLAWLDITQYMQKIGLDLECSNCESNSNKQIVHYWVNDTDCSWLNETLNALKYWSYDNYHLISLDKDVCADTSIVTDVFPDLTLRGTVKNQNRDRYLFINTSVDKDLQVLLWSDSLGLDTVFDGKTSKTKATDSNGVVWADSDLVYVDSFTIEGNKVTFYIDNLASNTIWARRIVMLNHAKWTSLQALTGLYTSKTNKKIAVIPTYDVATDTITIRPANANEKIPIEPATGSNELVIEISPLVPLLSKTLVGMVMGAGAIIFLIGTILSAPEMINPASTEDWVKLFILIIVMFSILGIALGMIA